MHKKEYRPKEKAWKDKNYLTFCFHLPKELVREFRIKTKKNGDTQRQLVIEMIENYNMYKKAKSRGKVLLNKELEEKDKEIERLNNVINEIYKCVDDLYRSFDYEADENKILGKVLNEIERINEVDIHNIVERVN